MALDQIDMRLIDKVITENDELRAEKEKLLSLIDNMKHASNDLEAKLQSTQSKLDEALSVIEDLGNHMGDCECRCMDYKGIARTALQKLRGNEE